jgi:hypothetical protein
MLGGDIATDSNLSFQVNDFLQKFIACGDNSRICLETTLGYNHTRKLLSKVNISIAQGRQT